MHALKTIMLRKVYLSKSLPQDSLISHALPDVKQSMDAYRQSKSDFTNEAPEIHPQPLEKYEGRKTKIEITSKERENEVLDKPDSDEEADSYEEMILTLPQAARRRAVRLLPFVLKINYGNLNLRDLLYDLAVPRVTRIKSNNRELLESVYRQLENNPSLPRQYYVHKLSPKTPQRTPARPKVTTHPKQARIKRLSITPRKEYPTSTWS